MFTHILTYFSCQSGTDAKPSSITILSGGPLLRSQFLILPLLFFVTLSNTYGASVSWKGGPGDWSDGTKWDTGIVPQSGDDVKVVAPGSFVTLDVNSNCINSLTIDENAQVLISSGTQLTLTGASVQAILITKGTLHNDGTILVSSYTGKAIRIENLGVLTNFDVININDILNDDALINFGNIQNNGSIHINKSTMNGIVNYGVIENVNLIEIINAVKNGVENHGTLSNLDSLLISAIGGHGVYNFDSLYNSSSSRIDIRDVQQNGIHNEGSISTTINDGTIFIFDFEKNGIWNEGVLANNKSLNVNGNHNGGPNFSFVYNSGTFEIGPFGALNATNFSGNYLLDVGILICHGIIILEND